MSRTAEPAPPNAPATWRPSLGALRMVGGRRTVLLLSRDATVQWWCAPQFDDVPLCWQLLDARGGAARFRGVQYVDAVDAPAGSTATTVLRDAIGRIEVRDALLPRGDGALLVRLLRRLDRTSGQVEHELRLGGFDTPVATWDATPAGATGAVAGREMHVSGGLSSVDGDALVTRVDVGSGQWSALVIGVDARSDETADELCRKVDGHERGERQRLHSSLLPRTHPQRALDALAVIRCCTHGGTGAVVAAPTTSLPEAPGHDRQFDYRYTWLRDASLSTAVAGLLGHGDDARSYLDFVHEMWKEHDLVTTPMLDVRGGRVPEEREVAGVAGWAGSQPIRVGNGATAQRQYDSVGLFVEAVSVLVQVGGELDRRTWSLVRRLADQIAEEDPTQVQDSNGIWEMRQAQPLVDGDLGRWLALDRALWVARVWRPWTRRGHWRAARSQIAERVLSSLQDGLLPQAYGQDPPVPDASALMAVAFGLLDGNDPRASRLVDVVLERLGAGPYLYRYPPGRDDGFSGVEGAFLPMSFLAVTALARVGRVQEAKTRLDRLCAALPRLLAEEVDPASNQLLGNAPLVWSHAELARAVYVLDAAERRDRWGRAGLWAWRLQRYVRLRHRQRSSTSSAAPDEEDSMRTRTSPAGPPAATVRPRSGGIGRGGSAAAEAVSDALRRGDSAYLDGRRRGALLQLASAASLGVVALYQFGLLKSVPELRLPGLDADRVDASAEAYSVLRTPDAGLGIVSAGVSLVLAGMGSDKRHQERPWVPIALLAKSVFDAASGAYLLAEQVTKHRRICSWCTVSAGLLMATVPASLPEARAAWRTWRDR